MNPATIRIQPISTAEIVLNGHPPEKHAIHIQKNLC